MVEKQCIACKQVLPESEFYAHKQRRPGESPLSSRCRECAKAWARERYETVLKNDETHKAKQREISSAHYKKNREHIVARRKARRAEINEWRTQHIRELRAKCIQLYGGKCECCGETRPEFLAFDHINGGGTKQRKSLGGHFVEWLASRPAKDPGIRVLCHNCNSALAFYGYCPHQRK